MIFSRRCSLRYRTDITHFFFYVFIPPLHTCSRFLYPSSSTRPPADVVDSGQYQRLAVMGACIRAKLGEITASGTQRNLAGIALVLVLEE
eukprot:m.35232 g.35232  ORF g.35232 m.35232 type:complete len:90 (+) comp10903_c0_seq2:321-590(+)